MQAKIPATIVTGFLGSGKTTLLKSIIRQANGRRIALLINEFGDIGVDGEILRGCGVDGCRDEDLIELSNGCICCTVADDFIPAMEKILQNGSRPDHIVIETSGLALPQPLVRAFNWPEIASDVTVDGVVTVVDGAALASGKVAGDEDAIARQRAADKAIDHSASVSELFEDQLACADIVILSKADLLRDGATGLSEQLRAKLRPGVSVIPSKMGDVDTRALLGLGIEAELDLESRTARHPHHNHDHDHHHVRPSKAGEEHHSDEHGHDAFDSFVVELPAVKSVHSLLETVSKAIDSHSLLRVKGFAAVEDRPMRLVVQAVGARSESYFDRPFGPDEPRSSRLVVIGHSDMNRSAITTDLQAAAA